MPASAETSSREGIASDAELLTQSGPADASAVRFRVSRREKPAVRPLLMNEEEPGKEKTE